MSKPAPQLQNSATDEDWIQALEEVEGIIVDELDDERDRHKSAAATIREKGKRKIKMLCRELGMDEEVFKAKLAERSEDRKYFERKKKRAEQMPDTKIELWADVSGQYNWLPPGDEPETVGQPETFAQRANRERIEAIQRITDEEAAAGAEALNELSGGTVN
jgi:hypothetical protein